jgi:hypothetical protein
MVLANLLDWIDFLIPGIIGDWIKTVYVGIGIALQSQSNTQKLWATLGIRSKCAPILGIWAHFNLIPNKYQSRDWIGYIVGNGTGRGAGRCLAKI